MEKVLELRNLHFSYCGNKKAIIRGINWTFEAGTLYVIQGMSGCGKTTLLSLIGGLDVPTKGEIIVKGSSIVKKDLEKHRKENVAFVFQSYNLIEYMTPAENVNLVTSESPFSILEQVGITREEAGRNVQKLSGGQQQRVAIARALASKAPILLADEPTGSLDSDSAGYITELLIKSAHVNKRCVIAVTHSNEFADQADVLCHLKNGNLIMEKR